MNAVETPLKIYPAGRNIWRCESGQNNYKISSNAPGQYHCSCPARIECRHIKQLKGLQGIQSAVPQSAPVERRKSDRRSALPTPTPHQKTQVESLRAELLPLLHGFKKDLVVPACNAEVERLRLELARVLRLGFGCDRRFVFLNDKYNCTWYFMDGDNHVPIQAKFLYGYLRKIEFKARSGNVRPSHHLHLTVEGDQNYVLITGYDNHFSKGLIAAIVQMRPEQLACPIWIQPQKTGLTTLCNLHQNGALIRGYYSKDEAKNDWKAMSIKAMERLKASRSQ